MSLSADFAEFLKDQLAGVGPVSVRRMFSGAGLFLDGLMFALVIDDVLYFKTAEDERARFEAEGLKPFSYATKTGRHTLTSYWQAPGRCLDDPDEMKDWASRAVAAAHQAEGVKVRPKTKAKPRRTVASGAGRRAKP
jgi:DNA transformation protein and related proteins